NYGIRYEYYPMAYKDHSGVYIAVPSLPQAANVEIGGVGGNPQDAGVDVGWGFIAPRLGIAYRINDKTVIRTGGRMTSDPDSFRFLRDASPATIIAGYNSNAVGQVAVDPANNSAPMTLVTGIPAPIQPVITSGFTALPTAAGTATVDAHFHRGYIE